MDKKTQKIIQEIPGWLTLTEAIFLAKTARKTQRLKGEIVEIGSFLGRSTVCLAQGKGKVYSVDPHKGYVERGRKYRPTYGHFIENLKKAGVFKKTVPIVKTSHQASKNWNKKIRFLFIDALHDEKNATRDYELWSKHLVENGVIAIHDSFLRWTGSEKVAIRKIVNSQDFYKIGTVGSIIYGIKGNQTGAIGILKLLKKFYIISLTYLNHVVRIFLDFPSIYKKYKKRNRKYYLRSKFLLSLFTIYKVSKVELVTDLVPHSNLVIVL